MIRTYKRKLQPSSEQAGRIASWIGACRLVYNLGLEIKIATYKNQGRNATAFELMKQLPALKREYPWIADMPSQSLQAVLDRLDRSFQTFFKSGGFPHWASKKKYKSIHLKSVKVSGNSVIIPKMGSVRMFKDAPVTGTPKTAQVVLEPTGIFICIQCELTHQRLCGESQAAIGMDMGIAHFCILSDGTMVENPKHFARHERKLRRANRSLARKKKGSNGWKRQVKLLAKLHHTIGNARRDFLHKESTRIARIYSLVFVEDLNIRGMSRNRHLSRHILDCGWGMFQDMLSYKTSVVKVDPRYTSQTCHECRAIDAKSRVSRSEFICTHCGHESHADVNAAQNILSRGAALLRKREAQACA